MAGFQIRVNTTIHFARWHIYFFLSLSLDYFLVFLILLAGILFNSGKPYEIHLGGCQNKLLIISDVAPKECSIIVNFLFGNCSPLLHSGSAKRRGKKPILHMPHLVSCPRREDRVGTVCGVRMRVFLMLTKDFYYRPISYIPLGTLRGWNP